MGRCHALMIGSYRIVGKQRELLYWVRRLALLSCEGAPRFASYILLFLIRALQAGPVRMR